MTDYRCMCLKEKRAAKKKKDGGSHVFYVMDFKGGGKTKHGTLSQSHQQNNVVLKNPDICSIDSFYFRAQMDAKKRNLYFIFQWRVQWREPVVGEGGCSLFFLFCTEKKVHSVKLFPS